MSVNSKKPVSFKNRTKYFDASKDKAFVTVQSPKTYKSRQQKIEGYETRLYWQYRYCQDNFGQTFYYTLTYNDEALPVHYGIHCFDYEDLRDLLTGGFRKQLLRKYGTKFKYFVSAELGDGKGERGLHNNPHYHILFFLEPANNPKFDYSLISPEEFRHLIRIYWQGFDQDEKRVDFRKCRYGIAKEGSRNIGLVDSFDACVYVAKYVCKDVKLIMHESKIRTILYGRLKEYVHKDLNFYKLFVRDVLYNLYGIPSDSNNNDVDISNILAKLQPDLAEFFSKIQGVKVDDFFNEDLIIGDVKRICKRYSLWKYFNEYRSKYIDNLVDSSITEWRNRFSNKCRISHGVGDYALKFIKDKDNPMIEVPSKDGMKLRNLNLYYYRKLFTTIVQPFEVNFFKKCVPYECIRILNDDGIKYKVSQLPSKLEKLAEKSRNNLEILFNKPSLFDTIKNSDVNTDVFYDFQDFRRRYYDICAFDTNVNIFHRYAEYKLVYEGRFFSLQQDRFGRNIVVPDCHCHEDYERFLVPSIFSVSRSDLRLDSFLEGDTKGYISYDEHPYFLYYIGIFRVFDLLTDYFYIQKDNRDQDEAERRAEIRRFHKKRELKEYYKSISI